MYMKGNILYADEGKLLDFKEPKYAMNEEGKKVRAHLYTARIRLGRMDKEDNYIEVDKSEVN